MKEYTLEYQYEYQGRMKIVANSEQEARDIMTERLTRCGCAEGEGLSTKYENERIHYIGEAPGTPAEGGKE